MLAALALVSACQDPVDWAAVARDHEWNRRFDHAVVAWAKHVAETDDEQARRELARLNAWNENLRFVLRPPEGAEEGWDGPSVDVASGRVVVAWNGLNAFSTTDGSRISGPVALPFEIVAHLEVDPTGTKALLWNGTGDGPSLAAVDVETGDVLLEVDRHDWPTRWGPSGERLAITCLDERDNQIVRVWDVGSGDVLFESPGMHTYWDELKAEGIDEESISYVSDIAFSPDGERLAITGDSVSVHDLATGQTLFRSDVEVEGRVRFHPDGGTLVVHPAFGGFRTIDLRAGRLSNRDIGGLGYGSSSASLACSPDGDRWVVAEHDEFAAVELSTELPAFQPPVRDNLEHQLDRREYHEDHALSSDGAYFAKAGRHGTIRVWDTRTGRRIGAPIVAPAGVRSLHITDDGAFVAGLLDLSLRAWDILGMEPIDVVSWGDGEGIVAAAGSPSALVLREVHSVAVIGAGETVHAEFGLPGEPDVLGVSEDASTLVTSLSKGGDWIWDLERPDPESSGRLVLDRYFWRIPALDRDGRRVAIGAADGIFVLSTASGELLEHYRAPGWGDDGAISLGFDGDGGVILSNSAGLGSPGRSASLSEHEGECLAALPDGSSAIWCAEDGAPVVWRGPAGTIDGIERLLSEDVWLDDPEWLTTRDRAIAVHGESATILDPIGWRVVGVVSHFLECEHTEARGDRLLMWSADGLSLHDLGDGEALLEHRAERPISAACIVPHTSRVAISMARHEVHGIDLLSGESHGPWLSSSSEPSAAAMHQGGRALIGFADGRVVRLDPGSGAWRELLRRNGVDVDRIAINADGRRAAVLDGNGLVTLLDVESGKIVYRRSLVEHALQVGRDPDTEGLRGPFMSFSEDGGRLLLGASVRVKSSEGEGFIAQPWAGVVDAGIGGLISTLDGFEGSSPLGRISRDGERVFIGSFRRAATWNATTGELLARIDLDRTIRDAVFRPDDRSVVIATDDGSGVPARGGELREVLVWDADRTPPDVRSVTAPLRGHMFRLDPSGRHVLHTRDDGPMGWLDTATLDENPIEGLFDTWGPLRGPAELVLLEGGRLGRLAGGTLAPIAVRRWLPDASQFVSWNGVFSCFIDERRVYVGARSTPSGMQPIVVDHGPATESPAEGGGAELVDRWSRRLGLSARADGTIVATDRR